LISVRDGYDAIAEKFSQTRNKAFWDELGFIKKFAGPKVRIFDFGCGNGRLAKYLAGDFFHYTGADVSEKLLAIARKDNSGDKIDFDKIDPLDERLPYGDKSFDLVTVIAVMHHIPEDRRRLRVAKELNRVLADGGILVASVWNLKNEKPTRSRIEIDKTNDLVSTAGENETYIAFKDGKKVFQRYHYVFSPKSLEKLFEKAGVVTTKLRDERRNIIYEGKKRTPKRTS